MTVIAIEISERFVMSKVVAITGFYNRGSKVKATLESMLQQTHDNYEVHMFDDASTDDTEEHVSKLHNDGWRFKYHKNKSNLGFTKSLIETIANTESDYVAIVGSGDVCSPERFRLQAEALDADPSIGLVGSHFTKVLEDGTRLYKVPNDAGGTFSSMLKKNWLAHGEVMFRRSTYEAAGGYRESFKFSQDYDLWLRMIKLSKFAIIPVNLYDRNFESNAVSFAPEKFTLQARYSLAAQKIASSIDPDVEYLKMRDLGVTSYIPTEYPGLQMKLAKIAFRNIFWRNHEAAAEVADRYLTNRLYKTLVGVAAKLASTPAGRFAIDRIFRILGRTA